MGFSIFQPGVGGGVFANFLMKLKILPISRGWVLNYGVFGKKFFVVHFIFLKMETQPSNRFTKNLKIKEHKWGTIQHPSFTINHASPKQNKNLGRRVRS